MAYSSDELAAKRDSLFDRHLAARVNRPNEAARLDEEYLAVIDLLNEPWDRRFGPKGSCRPLLSSRA